jgi:uracil-DNA glycosylase family 4
MLMSQFATLLELNQTIVDCQRCPRLVEYRQRVAREKRRAYHDWDYWGRPVPGFGDPAAHLLIVGLAPGAHGSNRTGRMFTGDASGDFLYAALYRAGFANQPSSGQRDDGLTLHDCYITAVARCSPPGNRPTRDELDNCRPYLEAELGLLANAQVILALGKIAFDGCLAALAQRGIQVPRPRPSFAHGVVYTFADPMALITSYHPSQQNTNTGRLTVAMFDAVLTRIRDELLD